MDQNEPWADPWDSFLREKLQYKLYGLAQECVLEKTELREVNVSMEDEDEPVRLRRKKFFFRVTLAGPSFALSFIIKLQSQCTWHLENILVERSLDHEHFDTLVKKDGSIDLMSEPEEEENMSTSTSKTKKRVIEIGRAAKVIRFAIWDVESDHKSIPAEIVGVNVVGFARGANPTPNRLKVLLNAGSTLAYISGAHVDRAEVDTLCGVALINARKYRQAAEILLRASAEAALAAKAMPSLRQELMRWGEHILLLAAQSFLECEHQVPEAIRTLISMASYSTERQQKETPLRPTDFVDIKTTMLSLQPQLTKTLIAAVEESDSPTVRLAGAKLLEYLIDCLSCAVGSSLEDILMCVLSNYKCFSSKDSSTLIQRNLEQTFSNIIDASCRLLPALDHATLLRLFQSTLVPVISSSDFDRVEADQDSWEFSSTALAQMLRVLYITVDILEGDVDMPTDLVLTLFSISRTPSEGHTIPSVLRRVAIICCDAVTRCMALAAKHKEASEFNHYLIMMRELLEDLFQVKREDDLQTMESLDFCSQSSSTDGHGPPVTFEVSSGEGEELRLHISDTKTLDRVLNMVIECVSALDPCRTATSLNGVRDLKGTILNTITDLSRSAMLDIAHMEARRNVAKVPHSQVETKYDSFDLGPVLMTLAELWRALWLVIRLLPRNLRHQAEEIPAMREIFEFIIERLKHRSPPQALLRLLYVLVKGAGHEFNEARTKRDFCMQMLSMLRALTPWVSQALNYEIFDLVEVLVDITARYLMPEDLLNLLVALSDQSSEEIRVRADAVLDEVASTVIMTTPEDLQEVLQALEAFASRCGSRRIVVSLPYKGGTKYLNMESFYLHFLLSTCFQKFDALMARKSCQNGFRHSAESIDEFVEHATLTVACLSAAAKNGRIEHREYVSELLGDIFGTCLSMHNHLDSRVRLAGLDIFCASMDVVLVVSPTKEEEDSVYGDALVLNTVGLITCKRESRGGMEKEEKAWNFLCQFVTTILGTGNSNDHSVQRSCLMFLKDCCLGALLGRRSGASVIGMDNVMKLWKALVKITASTWRVLSGLAFWIQCILINVAFYVAICGGGRSAERWNAFNAFLKEAVFPHIFQGVLGAIHEKRLWAIRLVESYLRVRDMNGVKKEAPGVPQEIWESIDALKEDWNDDVARTAGSLRYFTLDAMPTAVGLDRKKAVELWIPEIPENLLSFDCNAGITAIKTLEVFLREHHAEPEPEATEMDLNDWVHVSDVSALEEPVPESDSITVETAELAAEQHILTEPSYSFSTSRKDDLFAVEEEIAADDAAETKQTNGSTDGEGTLDETDLEGTFHALRVDEMESVIGTGAAQAQEFFENAELSSLQLRSSIIPSSGLTSSKSLGATPSTKSAALRAQALEALTPLHKTTNRGYPEEKSP